MSTAKALTCTNGFATLERPIYSPGLLLEDEDLTTGVNYTRRLTQLLFSSLFGCGVICGLRVKAWKECDGRRLKVEVGKGLGLDCLGNPIEVPGPQILCYDPDCAAFPPAIWVVACYVERPCSPRELSCSYDSGDERSMTRARQGFEIKLYGSQPECACSCEPPAETRAEEPGRCCPPDETKVNGGKAGDERKAEEAGADKAESSCYDDHVNGVCSCGCGCYCIVIGKITLIRKGDGMVLEEVDDKDRSVVREIRPFLIGQLNERLRAGSARSSKNTTESDGKAALV